MRKIKTIGIVAAAVVLAAAITGGTALAVTSGTGNQSCQKPTTSWKGSQRDTKPGDLYTKFLDKLVTAGTITQADATAVENALKAATTSGQKPDLKTVLGQPCLGGHDYPGQGDGHRKRHEAAGPNGQR